MRFLTTLTCLLLTVLLTSVASAENDAPKKDRSGRRAEMREKMIQEFDADGDGELNDDERSSAREAMKSRRANKKGNKAKGKKGKGKGKEGKAKRKRDGKGRRDGPPEPGKIFDKFDANGDGQLSREEFMKLAKQMRDRHEKMRDRHGRGMRDGRGPKRGSAGKPGPRRGRGRPDAKEGADLDIDLEDSMADSD